MVEISSKKSMMRICCSSSLKSDVIDQIWKTMFPTQSGCVEVDYNLSFVIFFNIFGIYLSIMPLPICSLGHIHIGINGMTLYDFNKEIHQGVAAIYSHCSMMY